MLEACSLFSWFRVCVVWRCVVQLKRTYPTESQLARKSLQKVKILSSHAANAGNIRDCQSPGKQDYKQTSRTKGQRTAPNYTGSDYPCRKRSKLDGPRWLSYGLLSNIQGIRKSKQDKEGNTRRIRRLRESSGLGNQMTQRIRDQDDPENRSRYCKEYSQRVYNINGSIRCR